MSGEDSSRVSVSSTELAVWSSPTYPIQYDGLGRICMTTVLLPYWNPRPPILVITKQFVGFSLMRQIWLWKKLQFTTRQIGEEVGFFYTLWRSWFSSPAKEWYVESISVYEKVNVEWAFVRVTGRTYFIWLKTTWQQGPLMMNLLLSHFRAACSYN